MAGVPNPIPCETFNDLIGRPVIDNGRIVGHLAIIPAKKERDPFVKLYQTGATVALAKNRAATATTLRVYLVLLDRLRYDNAIAVSQREIAETLGIHRANVAKELKKLTALDVIERGEQIANVNTYRLNRDYAWKGDPR